MFCGQLRWKERNLLYSPVYLLHVLMVVSCVHVSLRSVVQSNADFVLTVIRSCIVLFCIIRSTVASH
jgi:hypothetical protein